MISKAWTLLKSAKTSLDILNILFLIAVSYLSDRIIFVFSLLSRQK